MLMSLYKVYTYISSYIVILSVNQEKYVGRLKLLLPLGIPTYTLIHIQKRTEDSTVWKNQEKNLESGEWANEGSEREGEG